MHTHVSGRGVKIPFRNSVSLSGDRPHSLNRYTSGSFGSAEFPQTVSPLRLISDTKGQIKRTGAKASDGLEIELTSHYDMSEGKKSAAQNEVRNIGLMLMNPNQNLPISLKMFYQTKHEALNAIMIHIENYQDSEPFLIDSLKVFRQMIYLDPTDNKDVQEALYRFLGKESTSDLTKNVYFDLVQADAYTTFKNFNLKRYLKKFKENVPEEVLEFWKIFSTKEKSEESLVPEMEKMILQELNSASSEIGIGAQWIPIIFATVSAAEREKISLFGMLYRLSQIKNVSDGHTLRGLALIEGKIIAREACKRLASTSATLERRYETLLRQDARETLLKTSLSEFSLQISLTKNTLLKNALHTLLFKPDTVNSEKDLQLETLLSFLRKEANEPNMWTEDYQLTIQILYHYGKSLIEKEMQNCKNKTFQAVLRTLEDFKCAKGVRENSIFALEALRILRSVSKERGLENSRMTAASYLDSLSSYFATYYWWINAALTASPTRSRTEIEGDIVREEILERIKLFESKEMSLQVNNLFEDLGYTSMDEKYQIIEGLKHSIMKNSEEIENQNFLTSSNWRHFLLLSLITTKSLQSSTDSNSRFFLHLMGELEDLCHTSSVLNNELALISLKVLRQHVPQSLVVRALKT